MIRFGPLFCVRTVSFGFALLAFCPGTSAAQEGSFAVTDVRVFDGHRVRETQTVIVRDGRISSLAPTSREAVPLPDVDGSNRTLLPGLIDAHVHAHEPAHLRAAIRFGVTTVLDLFALPEEAAELRRLAATSADVADYLSAGICATAPGGHGTQYGFEIPTITHHEDVPGFLGDRLKDGSDYIKIIVERGSRSGIPTLDEATVRALVRESHGANKIVIAHVSRASDALLTLDAGVDGLAHVWTRDRLNDPSGYEAFRDRGAFVIPTLAVFEGSLGGGEALLEDPAVRPLLSPEAIASLRAQSRFSTEERLRNGMHNVAQLAKSGALLLAGSDAANAGTYYGVSLHRELELLVEAGLTPLQALTAATSSPAGAFGLKDRGSIAPGLRADLVLVEGDPLAEIAHTRKIVAVWRGGRLVEDRRQ